MRHRFVPALGAAIVGFAFGASVLLPPSPSEAAKAAPAPYRATSPEYGMSVFVFGNPGTTERDLAKLRELSFSWQKTLFRWRDIEGDCKGCFRWDEADRVVRASADSGLKIIARIDFQPTWARADGAHNGAPDNFQDFADFLRAFTARYRSGSPHGTVQAIEVWNEVNLLREWGSPISRQSAADYVRMLNVSYQAIKSIDPTISVITAGLSPTGWSDDTARPDDEFLQWLYDSGMKGGVNYDVLGAHGNTQCPSVEAAFGHCPGFGDRMAHPSFYFRRIEQLRQIMVANGDADYQVWLLEFGWTSDTVNPNYAWFATTEERKATLIVEAFKYARANWSPWMGVMTLWTLPDPGWGPEREELHWSVTNPDGSARQAFHRLLQARTSGELP